MSSTNRSLWGSVYLTALDLLNLASSHSPAFAKVALHNCCSLEAYFGVGVEDVLAHVLPHSPKGLLAKYHTLRNPRASMGR